jgi:hypothetical protein
MIHAQGGSGRQALARAALAALVISVAGVAWTAPGALASGVWLQPSSPTEAGDLWTAARV